MTPPTQPYVPGRGDLVFLDFDPVKGHEQAGVRPALVLSPISYNSKVGLALVCPITSRAKGYPFEVALPAGLAIGGVILTDQVKSISWPHRNVSYRDSLPVEVFRQVVSIVLGLLTKR
ncbi:MAG: endoribonuclease MazF [Chloroflexota bacterium]|nr:endoribonuclease MazF [Chloroflexota bacterium]MDQ5866792.1 endoribonuclease MazF [Chloroflexota bacterium]